MQNGKIPERKDIPVNTEDNVEGFEYTCYNGTEVFRLSECDGKAFESWPPVIDQLKEGEKVITCVFGVYQQGVVCKDGNDFYVDVGPNITDLRFDEDDRHCWTTSNAINKQAMQNILSKEQ